MTRQQKYQRVAAYVGFVSIFLPAVVAAEAMAFDEGWSLSQQVEIHGDGAGAELRIVTGRAVHQSVSMQNGTIELEMKLDGRRAFSYVQFRVDESGRNYEEIYFRNHKTRAPDALQYTPVDNGMSAWQLFHGQGKTAAVELPADQWIPVRLEIKDSKAVVFVGETAPGSTPAMVIDRLARPVGAGAIALRGFVARGSEADYSAHYRNLRVTPDRVRYDFGAVTPKAEAPAGTITRWRLSESFVPPSLVVPTLESLGDASSGRTQVAEVDVEGLLNIGRHVLRPESGRPWAVVASATIESSSTRRVQLDLGYSDAVSVFLNGEPLAMADDSYSYDLPRRQGVIGLFQLSLMLPLEAGDNELQIVVADQFGGWGLMGRLEASAIALTP